jgi:hypothetical protein
VRVNSIFSCQTQKSAIALPSLDQTLLANSNYPFFGAMSTWLDPKCKILKD